MSVGRGRGLKPFSVLRLSVGLKLGGTPDCDDLALALLEELLGREKKGCSVLCFSLGLYEGGIREGLVRVGAFEVVKAQACVVGKCTVEVEVVLIVVVVDRRIVDVEVVVVVLVE